VLLEACTPDKSYVGSEPLSFLMEAMRLVQAEIDKRHNHSHAFISTYGQPVGQWWLEHMQAVLHQIVVTALFGIVEGASREHLRNASVLSELHGWGQVRPAFEKRFNCKLDNIEGCLAVKRARLLANYFKHSGTESLAKLGRAWPLCAEIANDPERGVSQMWAGLPIRVLTEGVAKFLESLQNVVDQSR
jgi:hypothetical protein